jgi:hypothetical protein
MKKLILITSFFFLCTLAKAQTCKMEVGNLYNIYVFSQSSNFTLKEIFGEEVNPMLVNVIQIKDAENKNRIDALCLKTKMPTTIFVYPNKDKSKTKVFCTQEEYLKALVDLKMEE